MTQITRPVLRYHGGKWKLAPWIISHFPEHQIYVEPFGGGASVLLRKPRSYSEVYNDRWGVVVNVFRVLRDKGMAQDLKRQLELTPFARDEFRQCTEEQMASTADPVERARMTILRSFAGFGSASSNAGHLTGFRANSNRSGTTPAHDWANYPAQIERFVERLRGVVVENKDAISVIQQHDSPQTLFYVDPPYPHSTRQLRQRNEVYACEMTDDDHRALAETLHGVRGMVIVSGYPCDLYDRELYPNWHRTQRRAHGDGAVDRVEVLWMSPRAAVRSATIFDALEVAA